MSGNINSSAYYNVGGTSSGSHGLAGLMSGMDTEAMVQKMLSGTQNKIDKQEALKLQTSWKQDIYRDMITTINGFRSKFFDNLFGASSKNNFASNDFFNTMISKIQSGNAVKLLGSSPSASVGDFKIAVKQLASQASISSSESVSGDQSITGSALDEDKLTAMFDKKISFKIDSETVTVDLNNAKTQEAIVTEVQNEIKKAGITGVTAKIHDGKFRLVSTDPTTKISLDIAGSSTLGLTMTGMGSSSSSTIKDTDGNEKGKLMQGNLAMDLNANVSFDLTLDGVTKSIKLTDLRDKNDSNVALNTTKEKVLDAIQTQVKKAFGESIKVSMDADDRLKFNINITDANGKVEKGHELTITGMNVEEFGIKPGTSSHISGNSKLNSLGLAGDKFSFTINGTDFTFSGEDSISTVMSKINNSDAGVRITYSSISDTFKMEATSSGSKYGIEITQTEGDLLTTMFGKEIAAGGGAGSSQLKTGYIKGVALDANGVDYETKSASMKLKVNGKEYTYLLEPKPDGSAHTKEEIEKSLNLWMLNSFGHTVENSTFKANISIKDGELTIADGYTVEFAQTKIDQDDPKAKAEAMQNDLAFAMGLNKTATNNIAKEDTDITHIKALEGITFNGNPTKLSEITSIKIGTTDYAASFEDGRIILSGSGEIDLSIDSKAMALFGGNAKLTLGNGKLDSNAVSEGKDAIVIVNGVETTRNSNSFTIDGISMELTQVSELKKDANGNPVTGSVGKPVLKPDGTPATDTAGNPIFHALEETVISTSRDTDGMVESFKTFVDEYNKMIDKLNGYVSEASDYRKYPPLTAEQKKEMSDKEIELWEEKSKTGLVRSDSTVTSFLSQMRNILYTTPEGSNIALYQIGIETTKDYNDGGKIQLDETALRNALSSDPDAVRNLFTDTTDGLAKKLTSAMDGIAKSSLSAPGSLVQLAGVKGGSTEKFNTLYDRINGIESRIKDLKFKYEKERTRYWNQFNSMERILASFNSQSAMISQQFSGY